MESYQEVILALRESGATINDILYWLETEEQKKIGRTTLYRYLKEWAAPIQRKALTDDQIHTFVLPLAQRTLLSDTKIASNLAANEGFDISARQVKRARLKYRAVKKFLNPSERDAAWHETLQQLEALKARGGGILHGRRWAISHLRTHLGYRAFRDDIQQGMHLIDPIGVEQRLLHGRKRRTNFVTSGPDYMWCLDGHDKLLRYGIQIYPLCSFM